MRQVPTGSEPPLTLLRGVYRADVSASAVVEDGVVSGQERHAPMAGGGDDEAVGGVGVEGAGQPHAVHGDLRLDRSELDSWQGEGRSDPGANLSAEVKAALLGQQCDFPRGYGGDQREVGSYGIVNRGAGSAPEPRVIVYDPDQCRSALERCSLRPGNVHSADGWRDVLVPVVERHKERKVRRYFGGDAAFASPEICEYLEAEGMLYAIRLPANKVLQESIAHLLRRPAGRPPNHVRRYYASFSYQAGSWDRRRRVVAKVEWHPGELYPRVGFIVTNLSRPTERVVAFYNQRGTAEQWIKEGKNAIKWTRLSCRRFRNNEVRLQLHALAYNLANFMRTLALPKEVEHWSLTTLREKLVKIGAKVVRHGRYVTFQLAEVAVPRS